MAIIASRLDRRTLARAGFNASKRLANQAIDGAADLRLQHIHRPMAWRGEELPPPDSEQDSGSAQTAGKPGKSSPPATCFMKDRLEEDLFRRRRNLFTGLDLVFFDTTSHYFHGAGGCLLGRRGKSEDFRPQCAQVVVGLALSSDGRPLCTATWPGNTADLTTLLPLGKRLRRWFELGSTCLVADRGITSRATMDELERCGWGFILGCRIRNTKECRETVLRGPGEETLLELEREGRREPLRLHVTEVRVRDEVDGSERRCVVCRNGEQARRDKAVREATVDRLREQLEGSGSQDAECAGELRSGGEEAASALELVALPHAAPPALPRSRRGPRHCVMTRCAVRSGGHSAPCGPGWNRLRSGSRPALRRFRMTCDRCSGLTTSEDESALLAVYRQTNSLGIGHSRT